MSGLVIWLKNRLQDRQPGKASPPAPVEHFITPQVHLPPRPLFAPPHPTPFQHIISLGSDCDAALQLQRVGWLRTPSVFDWLITPWDAMLGVLQDNGGKLGEKITLTPEGTGAACSAYNLIYWHEFPRQKNGKIQITEEAAARARAKLTHKMSKLHTTLCGNDNVLLIRAGIATNVPNDRFATGQPLAGIELDRAAALIATLYPKLRFTLLCIEYPGRDRPDGTAARDPHIVRTRMPLPPPGAPQTRTKATDAEWDKLFEQIPYLPHPGSLQLNEELTA